MKELKNKEIIIGFVILIFLCILSLVLIVRREFARGEQQKTAENVTSQQEIEQKDWQEEEPATDISLESTAASKTPYVSQDIETETKEAQVALYNESEIKEASAYHTQPQLKAYTGEDMWQLEEIYNYWMEYQLDAVDDLIHLPRVRTITNELSGSNCFYYYGETTDKGIPNGSGLAVYEDNAYYCGSWENGKRSGEGMYWKIYPDKTGTMNGVSGVVEHLYNGNWQNDYPNGKGQEHFSYDYDALDSDKAISNVIGNFSNGYYDQEVYIMTVSGSGESMDWTADAKSGSFLAQKDVSVSATGKTAVWKNSAPNDSKDEYYWLSNAENKGYGVFGLKKRQ